MVRQIHEHTDSGDGILMGMRLVANANGESEVAHTHFVDGQFAVITFLLDIRQFSWLLVVHEGP